ncbi:hypothetical protein BDV26DRAFT_251807 [Aspergillus bertholletiae]|uniref:Zn(2)-C6 fungal-type domain-containing protein n=1 Tax=Aspergillus bertholletiae TaxID=1226010 RepID=A0A5N7BPB7_9EURO|nr:hypothetical protein BDV26DRAFT_251807 [Aspergillus bertholletiae]
MPEGTRSHRKGQYSCEFCRARKLRCDRPLPCTNCVSRGKTCHFGPSAGQQSTRAPRTGISSAVRLQQQQQVVSHPTPPPPQLSSPHPSGPDEGLLVEIQALRKLAQDLESRVVRSTGRQPDNNGGDCPLLPAHTSPESSGVEIGAASPSSLGQVSQVVAHLEHVSMVQNPQEPIYGGDLVFKAEHIRTIPRVPSYTVQLGKLTRCVWLPLHEEARVLLDKFITNVSYIHHVVHHPSLPATIDTIYRHISDQEPVKPGHLVLLLSIVTSATHAWTSHDDAEGEGTLFSSPAEANAQTSLWIKATYDVLNTGQNCPALSLETIQGIIILSFIICNLEGVSRRYRSLISTGLLLSRELGLHRIDHEPNAASRDIIEAEMGRRVWWYLIATDWLLAARYDGPGEGVYQANPRQMIVKKPHNINDVDLLDAGLPLDSPISQPTEMSYFLQRLRLAEISRSIVDHNPMTATSAGGASHYAHVTAMDFELDQMIQDIPSFLHLDAYEGSCDSTMSGTFIQAYLLNSVIHTQRCKLHLTYLTSGPNNNPAYTSSRETCLKSARQLIRAEAQLERAQHPFVQIRLRLSAILHGVFMASIVLLMDACINGNGSVQDEIRYGEAAEALRILENARSQSLAAANLLESLTQILAKHRAQQQVARVSAPLQLGATSTTAIASTTPSMSTASAHMYQRPDSLSLAATPNPVIESRTDSISNIPDQMPVMTAQPSYSNQLAQSLEELVDIDGFQWDDLFSGMEASSFF